MHCKTAKAVPCPARSAARPASTQGHKKPTKQSEQFSQHPQNSCFHLLSINILLESFILFLLIYFTYSAIFPLKYFELKVFYSSLKLKTKNIC